MSALLSVNNIDVYYGAIRAIDGVSFEVNEGEIVTLIGANGAGKSTILKTVSGLMRPKVGSVTFLGNDIAKIEPHILVKQGLTHVPEGRRIFLQLTVEENLEMGGYTLNKTDIKSGMDIAFSRFPRLKERRSQIAGTLSGGEQQMLAIGRALMSRPKLMMLDEPSMGLAPILVQQIFEIILSLNHDGTTILLVEQNAQMALSHANRGYVLETGRVVLTADAKDLLHNEEVKKAYLGI
ncbi:MAG: ABC transporter ATP-binding protein [Saccharofermentanales bacterium]